MKRQVCAYVIISYIVHVENEISDEEPTNIVAVSSNILATYSFHYETMSKAVYLEFHI